MPAMTWQFPPNDAGEIEGPNDPGISHFTDQRDINLIRESIQNSLDARAGDEPVKVECSLLDVPASAFEASQLRDILGYAIGSPHNDDKGREQFNRGARLLDYNRQLITLCIKDSSTTGADDAPRTVGAPSKWEALTKGSGSPVKEQKDAAGSFGLGKHSAFAVTDLRTVLYSTAWRNANRLNRRFIGKAILVSHTDSSRKLRRRTGYLSAGSYAPLKDNNVPYTFELKEPGTAIYIPGYELASNLGSIGWQRQSIATAIDNYFHAIIHRNLVVAVGDKEVNADNISEQYNALATSERLPRTINFIRVSKLGPVATAYFTGIGTVSLRIQVYDDQKAKVREIALVRDSGMMITAERRDMSLGLGGIPQLWRGFTVIIECISEPDKSSYIRDSESPKHDKLSVDYIDDPERRRQARARFQEMGQWARSQIESVAGLYVPESDDYVDELAKFLPIYDDNGKPGDLDKPATVSITAPRQSRNAGGGAGLLAGEHGGRRGGRRRAKKEGGSGGSGGRGGGRGNTGDGRRPPRSAVRGIRVRPVAGETHWVIATFDNPEQPLSEIQLVAVGEDGAQHALHIRQAESGGTPVEVANGNISRLPDTGVARYQVEIKTNEPVHGKTFRLVGRGPAGTPQQGEDE